ncbi:MAG: glycoside hydrolase family 25 protein [Oscillospiraceae bacterium]|nr:glycoside hydrolase family 25 protein [Oscillospiraceae bacterium]
MTIIKKLTALIAAGALSLGCITTAFAENTLLPEVLPNSETTIIDPITDETGESNETAESAESAESKESSKIEEGSETGESLPDSGVDLSDTEYTPIDISGYTEWDGKTPMEVGQNYYISKSAKVSKKFSVPAGSTLVVCSGAELLIYKDNAFGVRGTLISEPDSKITVSGTITVYANAGLDVYGAFNTTVSSTVRVLSELVIRHGAKAQISGVMNIYADGMYLNYGQTMLTANSKTVITGEMQTPSDGRLVCKGYLGITISGRSTQAGYFSLTGEFVNSGVLIFESTVKFYKAKSARFAISKSSRLIDYRYGTSYAPGENNPDKDMGETTDVGAKGIDVSYAQGAIDWAKVKASGVDFAMIRASRGEVNGRSIAQDVTFEYNITQATANGIKVGVYHYLYASTVTEARKEARFFLKTIEPYKITYPVVLDIEEQYQANLGKSRVTKVVKAFLDEISAAGYYTMIYANKTWLTDYLDMSQLLDYDVWLAQWNTVPTYDGDFGIWQYSSKGVVSGIDGYVDLNLSYKDYTSIIRKGNYNKLS